MKVFICTDHDGHYPVGVASVVVAKDEEDARILLNRALLADGLRVTEFTLQEVDTSKPHATILHNGEY